MMNLMAQTVSLASRALSPPATQAVPAAAAEAAGSPRGGVTAARDAGCAAAAGPAAELGATTVDVDAGSTAGGTGAAGASKGCRAGTGKAAVAAAAAGIAAGGAAAWALLHGKTRGAAVHHYQQGASAVAARLSMK